MYLLVGVTIILLIYQPSVLAAKPIPDDEPYVQQKRVFSEGMGAYNEEKMMHDMEPLVIEELMKEQAAAQYQQNPSEEAAEREFDVEVGGGGGENPEELQKVSQTQTKEHPEEPSSQEEEVPEKKQLKGEIEFSTFNDPSYASNLKKADVPVVEVKRAPAGTPVFSSVGSVTTNLGNTMFVATITACVVAAVFGLAVAGVVFRKIHKQHEAAREASYPQYGGTGPAIEKKGKKSPTASGDANLAYSAQLHHFNQTKQKIISTEAPQVEARGAESEDSEGDGDEGDYSVYECPGLAPTGDIEVSNPLFENASPKDKDAPASVSKTETD